MDTLLEEISEKEEASETLAADMGEREKRRLEEDQMAGQEIDAEKSELSINIYHVYYECQNLKPDTI